MRFIICAALLSIVGSLLIASHLHELDKPTETHFMPPTLVCTTVGPAQQDPIIINLIDLGYELDYRNGEWVYKDQVVGIAEEEDEPFSLCTSDAELIDAAHSERAAIEQAGGFPS